MPSGPQSSDRAAVALANRQKHMMPVKMYSSDDHTSRNSSSKSATLHNSSAFKQNIGVLVAIVPYLHPLLNIHKWQENVLEPALGFDQDVEQRNYHASTIPSYGTELRSPSLAQLGPAMTRHDEPLRLATSMDLVILFLIAQNICNHDPSLSKPQNILCRTRKRSGRQRHAIFYHHVAY